jgi:hypothetical protein
MAMRYLTAEAPRNPMQIANRTLERDHIRSNAAPFDLEPWGEVPPPPAAQRGAAVGCPRGDTRSFVL